MQAAGAQAAAQASAREAELQAQLEGAQAEAARAHDELRQLQAACSDADSVRAQVSGWFVADLHSPKSHPWHP